MVGVKGFEPSTSASRTQRSTKLSHTPAASLYSILPRPVNEKLEKIHTKCYS